MLEYLHCLIQFSYYSYDKEIFPISHKSNSYPFLRVHSAQGSMLYVLPLVFTTLGSTDFTKSNTHFCLLRHL